MTITDDFTVGSVLVWKDYNGGLAGHKVVDYVWQNVDGVSTKLWILRRGNVRDNQFNFAQAEAGLKFLIKTTEQVRTYGYEKVWTPEKEFQDGEFLTDSEGRVFYHENKNTVWKLSVGNDGYGVAHASLSTRVKQYGKLSVLKTASHRPFREIVK